MVTHAFLTGSSAQVVSSSKTLLEASRIVERIWSRDHRLWNPDPTEIANRLGWLTVLGEMRAQVLSLVNFAKSIRDRGITDVVLLGMGGSSLGPEVLRASFGSFPGRPRLWVLDSTVPGWVLKVTKTINPGKTLFIVASKSGGTIEVMSLLAHFWEHTHRVRGARTGDHFVAITDPSTSLEKLAAESQFWRIFTNQADIGGRYSVLSYFGLVPAALLGIDIDTLLGRAETMAERCRLHDPIDDNPGAALGAMMGALAREGRDKVTILSSPAITSFGLWAEQLLAESTGKDGKGLIPVAEEPLASASAYGQDRQFIYLRLEKDRNRSIDRLVDHLVRFNHPVLTLTLRDRYDLGAEFFRWEWATAVAGHLLGIHPFDQPNVQESKDNTSRVLGAVSATGRLPKATMSSPAQAGSKLRRFCRPGTYVAILTYATPSAKLERALRSLRAALITRFHVATTAGYGPRYLHSTGQLHKGGPESGIFLQLVEEMKQDLAIPGKPFTFRTLAHAQAVGDVQALQAHHRNVIAVSLGKNPTATITNIIRSFSSSSPTRRSGTKSRVRTSVRTK